ncbi:hypothetical protein D3C86_627410 [compost metagenome]
MLGAVHEDRHRQQGQGGGVEHQEEDLRVTGDGGTGIELLQRLHGFQADGRGRVVEAQTVGGEVQSDQAKGRVTGRDFRHQPKEQGAEYLGQPLDDPGLLGDAQKAQPQGEGAEQQHHDFDRELGHGENAFHHRRKDPGVAADQPLRQRRYGCHDEEAKPQAIEHQSNPPKRSANDSGVARNDKPRISPGFVWYCWHCSL